MWEHEIIEYKNYLKLERSLSDFANFLSKKGTKADVQPLQIITLGNQNKFGSILIVARE